MNSLKVSDISIFVNDIFTIVYMFLCYKDGLTFELNKKDLTAAVINSPNAKDKVFIPRSIEYESNEYLITRINPDSFKLNRKIVSIEVPENSELLSIGEGAFMNAFIKQISIPASFKEFEKGWCKQTQWLQNLILSPNNPHYKYFDPDQKLIIGKSDSNSDEFDVLVFVSRSIDHLTIPSFIKRISPYAISDTINLKQIEFSSDSQLELIDSCAFSNSFITEITLPCSVKRIESDAFNWCRILRKVNIPESSELLSIGQNAFYFTSIESLFLPASLATLDSGWCCNTHNLKNIKISQKNANFALIDDKMIVKKTEDGFDDLVFACRDVEEVTIPAKIRRISSHCFATCTSLFTINFSEDSELEFIGEFAFQAAPLTSLFFPKRLKRLCPFLLNMCSDLKDVEFAKDSELETISRSAFCESGIESISIVTTVSELEDGWCQRTAHLVQVFISPLNRFYRYLNDKLVVGKSDKNSDNYDVLAFACRDVEEASLPPEIRSIASFAFSECHLKKLEFSEDSKLESIGIEAFGFSSLPQFCLPRSCRLVCERAFAYCKVKKVAFADNCELSCIGRSAFMGAKIEEIVIPRKVKEIGDHAFNSCSKLSVVRFEKDSELEKIGSYAFSGLKIVKCTIPRHVKHIGCYAFGFCDKLNEIELDDDIELNSIDNNQFTNSSVVRLSIPKSIKVVSNAAFADSVKLRTIECFADSLCFENYCFGKLLSIFIVSLPNAHTVTISNDAFDSASNDFSLFVCPGIRIA